MLNGVKNAAKRVCKSGWREHCLFLSRKVKSLNVENPGESREERPQLNPCICLLLPLLLSFLSTHLPFLYSFTSLISTICLPLYSLFISLLSTLYLPFLYSFTSLISLFLIFYSLSRISSLSSFPLPIYCSYLSHLSYLLLLTLIFPLSAHFLLLSLSSFLSFTPYLLSSLYLPFLYSFTALIFPIFLHFYYSLLSPRYLPFLY